MQCNAMSSSVVIMKQMNYDAFKLYFLTKLIFISCGKLTSVFEAMNIGALPCGKQGKKILN